MRKYILLNLILGVFLMGVISCNQQQPFIDNTEYKQDSNDIETYLQKGLAKAKLGNDTGAIHDYDRAIEIDPKNAQAYYLRGVAKSELNQDIGATGELPSKDFTCSPNTTMKDIRLDLENNPTPYNSKGLGKFELGDNKGALLDFDKAIELDPNYAQAYFARGLVKKALGNNIGALNDLDKSEKLGYSNASVQIKKMQNIE